MIHARDIASFPEPEDRQLNTFEPDRRGFLAAAGALGAVWILGGERAAADPSHAHLPAGSQPQRLQWLSAEQAREIDAVASRIIPTDDTPGAHEAGVVYFIDRGLATFGKDQQPLFTKGLQELTDAAGKRFPGTTRFSRLTPAQQDEVLKDIESTPFFGALRFATIAGMFALPTHGGIRNYVGWKVIGQDLVLDYKPPFGYYDRPDVLARIRRGENP